MSARSEKPVIRRDGPALGEAETHRRLARSWATPPGLWGWLTTVDHKQVGRRYIVTAFVFFLLAGVLALAMRMQLSGPERMLLTPDR